MTVQELIRELEKHDPDLKVAVYFDYGYSGHDQVEFLRVKAADRCASRELHIPVETNFLELS